MNIGRRTLPVLIGFIASIAVEVSANQRLPGSVYDDWSAVVNETALPDESVLFDYASRTFSGRTESAMLAISFVPRFHCAPTVSIRTRANDDLSAETARLEITLDAERVLFEGVVDEVGEFLTYTIAASSDEQVQLRRKIDFASRISFQVLSSDAKATAPVGQYLQIDNAIANVPVAGRDVSEFDRDEAYKIEFSLLGSRLATLSAEKFCKGHKPLAFTPR